MGLLLQIIGVIILIVSLIYGIFSIMSGNSKSLVLILLVIGTSLVRIGRDIYKNKE